MEHVKTNLHNSSKLKYWFLLLSLLFHGSIVTNLPKRMGQMVSAKIPPKFVKLRLNQVKSTEGLPAKSIVEKIFKKTDLKPVEAAFLANVDHKALKQTRVSVLSPARAQDPGSAGIQRAHHEQVDAFKKLPSYEKLLANTLLGFKPAVPSLPKASTKGGYQDLIEDPKLAEGDVVDLDTREYRFVGYFTHMRKAIEMVWTYPREAADRGQHGKVGIRFTIQKNGDVTNVQVVHSSGYEILDESIRSAISQAAPFAPLPEGIARKDLTISGTFSYVLR